MIFAKRNNPGFALEEGIAAALEWAAANDLASLEKGQHIIDGDNLFANVIEYETTAPENRFWEAHKDYLDVHVPITGIEQIDLGFLPDMTAGEYKKEDDFQAADGQKNASVILMPGDFLVCYPDDVHRTAVAANGKSEPVKKAVIKVKINR